MGAWLATVAGEWEGCKCGLLGGAELSWLPLILGVQAGCGGKVGLFLVDSEQDAEL